MDDVKLDLLAITDHINDAAKLQDVANTAVAYIEYLEERVKKLESQKQNMKHALRL